MARTISQIKKQITDTFIQDQHIINVYQLDQTKSFEDQFALVSLENILFNIIAITHFVLETIFDTHRAEVLDILRQKKPHTARWYRNNALAFQYGFDLYDDSDVYDNTGKTDEQVENSKIIKYSAVTEAETESRLIVKIATETAGELQPIEANQKASFEAYLNEIKDAGVRITVINYLPDILRLRMKIFYDPLVLNPDGSLILNPSVKPVEQTIKDYMKKLPFDGELVLAHLVNELQKAEGIKIPHLEMAETSWIDPGVGGYGYFVPIEVKKIPVSGYFKIEDFNQIEYKV